MERRGRQARAFVLWTAISCVLSFASPARAARSIAFFYGPTPPVSALRSFDRVVLEPDHVDDATLATLAKDGVETYAYLSVGEVNRTRPYAAQVPDAWALGKRTAWNSVIVDPAQQGWRDLLLGEAEKLARRGFRGFFLDTLDSYESALSAEPDRASRARALATFVRALHAKVPDAKIVLNRGFAFLDEVAPLVSAVAAESLFSGWDAERRRYVEVTDDERRWILERLRHAEKLGIEAIAIDYAAPKDRAKAREVAKRIRALGLTPYVGNAELDRVGVGLVEPVPRRVLLLYDGHESASELDISVHTLIALPLEYMGYACDYVDVRRGLPQTPLSDRYAGLVAFFTDDDLPASSGYAEFLTRALDEGLHVALLGRLGGGLGPALLARLGLSPVTSVRPPLRLVGSDALVGFEAPVRFPSGDIIGLVGNGATRSHLRYADVDGQQVDAVVTAAWGGLALDPFILQPDFAQARRWVLDPFAFLAQALQLEEIPALDTTTENGRRILTVHVDGDGFVNRAEQPGTPYSAEVVRDEVLRRYELPTTVSVIEGEVGPEGLHPQESPTLERIAREIFALPHVELASHTYSHPFKWSRANADQPGDHLEIPGYRFDLSREVDGSVRYIDERLAPPGKKTRVFLWSGDASPGPEALALVEARGLANLNGGETQPDDENSSLTGVSPLGHPDGAGFQVYAPVQNENVYTNLWTGPFHGYRRVIEAFRITGEPRRLKPIGIYYHFYSGSKPAAVAALREVYDWALAQRPIPLFVSEYVAKAREFESAALARDLDGAWRIRGAQALRTLRLPTGTGTPQPSEGAGIVGYRDTAAGRYVATDGRPEVVLRLAGKTPPVPLLASSNARVERWEVGKNRVNVHLAGHVPVELSVVAPGRCTLALPGGKLLRARAEKGEQSFRLAAHDTGEAVLACP